MKSISFAIIGGGPAGFYTAKLLAKLPCNPQIHIYQKQLCPFGLIRYGVAPDHVSIKKSQVVLSEIENYNNFKYIGNNQVNSSFLKTLQQKYSGIVYSFGASGDPIPNIKNLKYNKPSNSKKQQQETAYKQSNQIESNVKMARQIVYWYNNHPQYQNYELNLSNIRDVTIIGNGNVAIDIARIFTRKPQQLSKTQISPNALKTLFKNDIRNVSIIGRRGLVQSAFALKQVRELTKFNIKLYAVKQQVQASLNDQSYHECTALGDHFSNVIRQNKRKIDFIKEKVELIEQKNLQKILENGQRKIIFRFLLNPHQLKDKNKLLFSRTYLTGQAFKQKAIQTDEVIEINHDLLIFSTGFQVQTIDHKSTSTNKLPNSNGCLINPQTQKIQLRQYTSGWCKTGPQGVIDQTLLGCQQTFNNIRIHYQNKILQPKPFIQQSSIFNPQKNISFSQYKQIRQIQLSQGNKQKFIKKKLSTKQIQQIYGIKSK